MSALRIIKSRLFLAIVLVLVTHMATTFYYTTYSKQQQNNSNQSTGKGNKIVIMKESRMVVFPSNPEYDPHKKSLDKPAANEILLKAPEDKPVKPSAPAGPPKLEAAIKPPKVVEPLSENQKPRTGEPSISPQVAKKSILPEGIPPPISNVTKLKPVQANTDGGKNSNTTTKQSNQHQDLVNTLPQAEANKTLQLEVVPEKVDAPQVAHKPINTESKSKTKLILAWTSLTSKKPEWGIKSYSFLHCPYKNCMITSDRSMLHQADLLIFRIRQLRAHASGISYRAYVPQLDFSDMPPVHDQHQMWMDINQESPVFTHADEEVAPLNGAFNLSVNYLLDSDFSISYIPIVRKKATPTPAVNYSQGKTKMALWFVSHCNAASGRDEYVKELQKYKITVDIFGKCTGKSDGCAPGNTTCYLEVRKNYKFYLAFENSICKEYITEKFWNTLTSDSYNIPIALGANMEEYKRFAPPDSYLHTRNFTSPRLLAEFMHKIDQNDDAFNSYHRWRETHEIVSRNQDETLHCYMCRQANEKVDGNQKYKNISEYWSLKKNCDMKPEPIV